MYSFGYTEEQKLISDTVRKFSLNEIRPVAAKYDQSGEFPIELMKQAFELGFMSELIPEADGGLGMKVLDSCIITEQLAYGCSGIATSVMVNNLGLLPIILGGTEEQKKKYLPRCAEEFTLVAFGLTEPGAGSDAAAVSTTAVRDGDDYILNGTKRFITNAGYADIYTVLAVTDKSERYKGKTAFIVEKDMPGVSVGKKEDKMGQRASDTCEIIFENARIPAENIIGSEGDGFGIFMRTLDFSRPMIGASATGLAQSALEHAIQYAQERKQFGKPIASFQGIQFMLAEMARDIEAARLLTYQAAWRVDEGLKGSKQSSISKLFATDAAMRITTDAVQIYGGYGFIKEYPVEKLMRDAKILQIYEGTNQIQRVVIAREILKEYALA